MVVQPIQVNLDNTKSQPSLKQRKVVKPYLQAGEKILTEQNVKPLPGQGYLIHDNPISSVKYFFKDIAYDLKSLKDGYQGNANDHQSGRLNDVGLKLGGLGIATYLASQTSNPKAKLMEFIGLGAFLTSMSLFPKLAINKPARIMHGFDIDKQYIDDQGRKKSVFQDPNYIPFDLYRGERKSEDLDVIADRMGIPKDTPNRHDIVKEQMRKIATQNNTLWMLTAAATPAMTGLFCCLLEQPVSSAMAHYRNAKHNKLIEEIFATTQNMSTEVAALKDNELSKEITKILSKYKKDGILPQEEFEHITELLTKNLDTRTRDNLITDLKEIFESGSNNGNKFTLFNNETIEETINASRKGISARKDRIAKIMPTVEEVKKAISEVVKDADFSKDVKFNHSDIEKLRVELEKIIDQKIANSPTSKNFLNDLKNTYINNFIANLKTQKTLGVNEGIIEKVNKLSTIIGDYKTNQSVIEKCKHFKFAHAPETIIANYSGKFERALLNELNFTQKELKMISESSDYAKQLLDKRLSEIAKDEIQYNRIVKNLTKIIAEMETALHGGSESESVLKKLVLAIETNADRTATRLGELGGFNETIKSLVNDNIEQLDSKFNSEKALRDFLDGCTPNFRNGNHMKEISGIGSYKHLQLTNLAERYQSSRNSFFRILEALDVYKRALNPAEYAPEMLSKIDGEQYVDDLIKVGKNTILDATCADHITKLNTVSNPHYYKDIINTLFRVETDSITNTTKGVLTNATEEAVGENQRLKNVIESLKRYIGRFYDIVPNNTSDTLKEGTHSLNVDVLKKYDKTVRTNKSIFDLVAQEPTEFLRGAADRRYGSRKWLSIIGGITAGIFAITYLAQLGFGKLNRPYKKETQVNNDNNK